MKIKDAIAHYRNGDMELDDPLYTLLYFAEKHAKKTGWINVYWDPINKKISYGQIWENRETAFAKIEKPGLCCIGVSQVEYYPED